MQSFLGFIFDLSSQVDSSATGHLTDTPAGQMLLLAPWSTYPALSTCPGMKKVNNHQEITRSQFIHSNNAYRVMVIGRSYTFASSNCHDISPNILKTAHLL